MWYIIVRASVSIGMNGMFYCAISIRQKHMIFMNSHTDVMLKCFYCVFHENNKKTFLVVATVT